MGTNQEPQRPTYAELWSEHWYRLISFLVPFALDVAIGSAVFVGLLWFHWLFKVAAAAGLKREYIEAYEAVHFWMNYALFVILGLDFIVRVVLRAVRGD